MRERGLAWVLSGLLMSLLAPSARGDSTELAAKLACEPAPGAGRVRCSLSVTAPAGSHFAWVDALVVKTPDFARALRTRIAHQGPAKASQAELLLALVVSGEGSGVLGVRARAVVCPNDGKAGRCRALTRLENLELKVGTSPPS
jgi:hypothetical protein